MLSSLPGQQEAKRETPAWRKSPTGGHRPWPGRPQGAEPEPEPGIPKSGTFLRVPEAGGCRTPGRMLLYQGLLTSLSSPHSHMCRGRQRISIGEAACSEPFAPHHTPSLAPRQRWPCAVDEQMPTHQPTHPCCCGGSPWGGHHPSVPGHSYPEVGPEVEAVAPGGLAASEVLSVSCEERVVRSSTPSLLLSHRPGAALSKASLGHHCFIV